MHVSRNNRSRPGQDVGIDQGFPSARAGGVVRFFCYDEAQAKPIKTKWVQVGGGDPGGGV